MPIGKSVLNSETPKPDNSSKESGEISNDSEIFETTPSGAAPAPGNGGIRVVVKAKPPLANTSAKVYADVSGNPAKVPETVLAGSGGTRPKNPKPVHKPEQKFHYKPRGDRCSRINLEELGMDPQEFVERLDESIGAATDEANAPVSFDFELDSPTDIFRILDYLHKNKSDTWRLDRDSLIELLQARLAQVYSTESVETVGIVEDTLVKRNKQLETQNQVLRQILMDKSKVDELWETAEENIFDPDGLIDSTHIEEDGSNQSNHGAAAMAAGGANVNQPKVCPDLESKVEQPKLDVQETDEKGAQAPTDQNFPAGMAGPPWYPLQHGANPFHQDVHQPPCPPQSGLYPALTGPRGPSAPPWPDDPNQRMPMAAAQTGFQSQPWYPYPPQWYPTPHFDPHVAMLMKSMSKPSLPKLSGDDYQEYITWKNMWKATYHHANIPTILKISYLKDSLKEGPKKTIEHYPLNESGYKAMLAMLEKQYGGVQKENCRNMVLINKLGHNGSVGAGSGNKQVESVKNAMVLVGSLLQNLIDDEQNQHVNPASPFVLLIKLKFCKTLQSKYQEFIRYKLMPDTIDSIAIFLDAMFDQNKETQDLQKLDPTPKADTAKKKGSSFAAITGSSVAQAEATATTATAKPKEAQQKLACPKCGAKHSLFFCFQFKKMNAKERYDFAKSHRYCFQCLGGIHQVKDCTFQKALCKKCTDPDKKHHYLLCRAKKNDETEGDKNKEKQDKDKDRRDNQDEPTVLATTSLHAACSEDSSFYGVPVLANGPNGTFRTVAILDTAGSETFIILDLADELGLTGQSINLDLQTLMGSGSLSTKEVSLEIQDVAGTIREKILAHTVQDIDRNIRILDWSTAKNKFPHLKDIPFPKIKRGDRIGLIIGTNHHELHAALEPDVLGPKGTPLARKTPLGYGCLGSSTPKLVAKRKSNSFMVHSVHPHLKEMRDNINRLSELEGTLGVRPQEKTPLNQMDQKMLDTVKQETTFDPVEKKYVVPVCWKKDPRLMASNFQSAKGRLMGLVRTKFKNDSYKKNYLNVVKKLKDNDHCEKVKVNPRTRGQCLMAHFGVEKESETTPLRVVMDGAAKGPEGESLNDYLCPGPKLQSSLTDLLIHFRMKPFALVGDISQMFLQVLLKPADRAFHRFLWATDEEGLKEPEVLQSTRWVFGNTQAPFAAQFAILKLIEDHGHKFPLAARFLEKHRYVDDLILSLDTESEAVELRRQLDELTSLGGFKVKKYLSNSKAVMETIPVEDRSQKWELTDADANLPKSKALGIVWDPETDKLQIFTKHQHLDGDCTRRSFLQIVASIFDPLNLLVPYVIRGRIMLQLAWNEPLDWDTFIDAELGTAMGSWLQELPELASIEMDRCVCKEGEKVLDLHAFSDASTEAYGSAIYVRTQNKDQEISVNLLVAKGRVAPKKVKQIPRLELMGLVLSTALGKAVVELTNLPITYWTDSANCVWWVLQEDRDFGVFVGNRLRTIHDNKQGAVVRHVPGDGNPADLISRGMTLKDLKESERWFHGADFLKLPESQWPEQKIEPIENDPERRKNKLGIVFFVRVAWQPRPEDFDTLQEFKVAMVGAMQRRGEAQQPPTVEDFRRADAKIWQIAQGEGFADEVERLQRGEPVRRTSSIARLNPRLDDDGVMRSHGRLAEEHTLESSARFPVILPKNHPVTTLVLKNAHTKTRCAHGTNGALCFLRTKFWIPSARQRLNVIRRQCPRCIRIHGRPRGQIEAPLPRVRLPPPFRAFAKVGVDFTGAFKIKIGRGNVQRKVYVLVITCTVSRAVHLEMAQSLEAEDFLIAFENFSNRRGKPLVVVSDNGTNLVAGDRLLRQAIERLDRDQVGRYAMNNNIEWKFGCPNEPHAGGVFESMVKTSKRAIFAVLREADLTFWEFNSTLIAAENLVNSRPLTYQTNNPDDYRVLTPNSLLFGQPCGQLAPMNVEEERYHPRQRWHHLQHVNKAVWRRWIREIMPELGPRHKWFRGQRDYRVGDGIIVMDKRMPRNFWMTGRVTGVDLGRDGHVRFLTLQTPEGEVRKSVHSVLPMDEGDDNEEEEEEGDDNEADE